MENCNDSKALAIEIAKILDKKKAHDVRAVSYTHLMVFKELEIQGFKSFPDKVKITFDAGVTGVVGPNGCLLYTSIPRALPLWSRP